MLTQGSNLDLQWDHWLCFNIKTIAFSDITKHEIPHLELNRKNCIEFNTVRVFLEQHLVDIRGTAAEQTLKNGFWYC